MHEPKVIEYTNVHVDDTLANNVSIKTSVNVYSNKLNTKERSQKLHQILPVEKDFAENMSPVSDVVEENKDTPVSTTKSEKNESDIQKGEVDILENNPGMSKKETLPEDPVNGNGDANVVANQQHENTSIAGKEQAQTNNASTRSKSLKGVDNVRIEKHKVHVMNHDLVVSGVSVSEKKEKIIVTVEDINGNPIADGKPIKTVIIHTRSIGERKYAMKETQALEGKTTESKVITEMSDIEIKKFEEDWKDYWIPTITDEQIESGEFEKELKELEFKESAENVIVKNFEGKDVKMDSIERELAPQDLETSSQIGEKSKVVEEMEVTQIDESIRMEEIEESAIETFVKENPLKVFGLAMLYIALISMLFSSSFLPEYPPCSWFKCILECIEQANAGES